MKQSKRVLSFLMAVIMAVSVFSVAATAAAPYKDGAITSYDDLDQPVFTLNQYATMVLDYADAVLAENNKVIDFGILGELKLTSINNALDDLAKLKNSYELMAFPPPSGDFNAIKSNLNILATVSRSSTPAATADLNLIYAVLNFLNASRDPLSKLIDGTFDPGAFGIYFDADGIDLNRFIKEWVWKFIHPGNPVLPVPVTEPLDDILQGALDAVLLGTPENPGFAPGLDGYIDLAGSTDPAYTFADNLFAAGYNTVVAPLLNTEFKKVVRAFCGVVYDETHPDGDESNLNAYAGVFNIDFEVPAHAFPADAAFAPQLNALLGEIVRAVLVGYTGWIPGGNDKLLNNLANTVKFILTRTGNAFFAEYIEVATPADIAAMSNQQLFSYLVRSVLNSVIDEMDIPADADTLTQVAWYTVKELCAQNIPANDYAAQPKTLDGILFMLADLLVWRINQQIDMNPGAGLLPYGQGLDATLTAVMNWVSAKYGGLFNLTLSSTDGWAALDAIVFSVIPTDWLPVSVGGSTKELLVNRVMRDVLELNAANFFALFDQRADSELATETGRKVLIDIVARLVNVVFPGSAKMTYTSFEEMLSNAELKIMAQNILAQAYTRRITIVPAVLPILAAVAGKSVPQKFRAPDIALPKQLFTTTTFQIRNNSVGLNTGATDKNGNFTQDALYRIQILSVTSSISALTPTDLAGTVINGGEAVNCTLSGTFTTNQILRVTMTYNVLTQDGSALTTQPLTAMAFSYIASPTLDDGDNYIKLDPNTNNKHSLRYKNIYINRDASLADMADTLISIDRDETSAMNHPLQATVSRTGATVPAAFADAGVTAAPFTNAATTYNGGTWFFKVFDVIPNANRPADGKTTITFSYRATNTSNSGGNENFSVPTSVILYDDFGLLGKISSALNANRDPNNYAGGASGVEWQNYLDALNDAVAVAYRPKLTSNFMTVQVPGFEPAAVNLENAVAALEATALPTGIEAIKTTLDAVQPPNDALAYDDDAYAYFGREDYLPHTYARYARERDAARALWNAQFGGAESSVPATAAAVEYALHRFNLYAGRLVRAQATKIRLSEDLARIQARGHTEDLYTAASWAAYERALAFAVKVNAMSETALDGNGDFLLRQSMVNEARTRLMRAEKDLALFAFLMPTQGSSAVVNARAGRITGLPEGADVLEYVTVPDGYYAQKINTPLGGGTGTRVRVFRSEEKSAAVAEFTVIIYGDINGDGNVDALDADMAIEKDNWLLTWDAPEDACRYLAGDLNGDGNVDALDADILAETANWRMEISQILGFAVVK